MAHELIDSSGPGNPKKPKSNLKTPSEALGVAGTTRSLTEVLLSSGDEVSYAAKRAILHTRVVGRYLGGLGLAAGVTEDALEGNLNAGTVFKVAAGVGVMTLGAPAALVYYSVDMGYYFYTGTTLTDTAAHNFNNMVNYYRR